MPLIPTIEGMAEPSADDLAYMDYLDDLTDTLPGGYTFGLLLFKADPVAFRLGRDEWKAEAEARLESDLAALPSPSVRHVVEIEDEGVKLYVSTVTLHGESFTRVEDEDGEGETIHYPGEIEPRTAATAYLDGTDPD